jgi:2-keto-4-pentenoate hydratase/2-oxohepta-3-ene-1,7-dioic acid hydratase in catechol pathway
VKGGVCIKLFHYECSDGVRVGLKTQEGFIDVRDAVEKQEISVPYTMSEILAGGEKALEELERLMESKPKVLDEKELVYAPCILQPEKIVCVGLNYVSHVGEFEMKLPQEPVLFSKFNNALTAHERPIPVSPYAEKLDYEAELVIIIGREGKDIPKEQALSYVFGYTTGNDLSERKSQFLSSQWLIGKSWDSFAPVGPYLVTADEIDPQNLDISCRVNGELRQHANTRDMLFDCASIISYVSRMITLKPGDMIFTGTPGGVMQGYPASEQRWLKAGDTVSVTIEGIGTLTNQLV